MIFRHIRQLSCFLVLVAALLSSAASDRSLADVIEVDTSAVDSRYKTVFENAEAFWESRIKNYSNDLPAALLSQLTALRITASTPAIDGPGNILGQAGPTGFLSDSSGGAPVTVAVTAAMEFDIADLPGLEADGTLQDVIIHEMAHSMGIGTLWVPNNLIEPLGGVGAVQYTNGVYALQEYRKEINDPAADYVPLEQFGGPGTALGHWEDIPPFFNQTFTQAFTKELLTGFLCDLDAAGRVVCPDHFVSETTWGAMADLGYEVAGINDNTQPPPPRNGSGRWPKYIINHGVGLTQVRPTSIAQGPFELNGVLPGPGVKFSLTNIKAKIKSSRTGGNGTNTSSAKSSKRDPYGLRNQAWAR